MKSHVSLLTGLALVTSAWGFAACSVDVGANAPDASANDASRPDASSSDASAIDAGTADASAADAPATDGGSSAAPTFVAKLDQTQGQLTEGLWQIGTTPIMGYAPLAQVVSVAANGGVAQFAVPASGAAQSTYTLGITADEAGSIYVAVAAAAAPPNNPEPGIYKVARAGGLGAPFSLGSAVTPAMNFPNGLDFIGSDLFVADSEGVIYKIDSAGHAVAWSQDALLAPDKTACNGLVPLPIGANGIAHDAHNVYVTNTTFGRLISIPIQSNGKAGTPSLIKQDCATLAGADGLVIDPKDGSFIIAVNAQNRIVRVTSSGAVTALASGGSLATPASVVIDTTGSTRRLLITNSTFFTPADAGAPGLLEMPLP